VLLLDEIRVRYATRDRSVRTERMVLEIGLGVPKTESFAVTDAVDGAMWDRLQRESDAARRGWKVASD
jgi:hypothetical protein